MWRDGNTRERRCSLGCLPRTFNFVGTEVVTWQMCLDKALENMTILQETAKPSGLGALGEGEGYWEGGDRSLANIMFDDIAECQWS